MKPILLAKRFVAGVTLEDAVRVAKDLEINGLCVTFDHLGEDVTNKNKARHATKVYVRILDEIKKRKLDSSISVKLSQIGLAIDKKLALKNLKKILSAAEEKGLIVEIDMEGGKYVDDTINIFLEVVRDYKEVVQAVQAYLYRAEKDVIEIIKRKGKIRLVKGAYKEGREVAFQDKRKVDEQYVKLVKLYLLKGSFIYIATHDEKIIKELISFTKKNKIPKKKFEFEMLYGIRRGLQKSLVSKSYNVRVYVPYGEEWFSYFYRRVRERKENFIFVIRNLFRK